MGARCALGAPHGVRKQLTAARLLGIDKQADTPELSPEQAQRAAADFATREWPMHVECSSFFSIRWRGWPGLVGSIGYGGARWLVGI